MILLPLEIHLSIVCNMLSVAGQVCVMSKYIFTDERDAMAGNLSSAEKKMKKFFHSS